MGALVRTLTHEEAKLELLSYLTLDYWDLLEALQKLDPDGYSIQPEDIV